MIFLMKPISCFKHLTEDIILQPYITQRVFRIENTAGGGTAVGYNLYGFDVSYQQNFFFAQPIQVQFEFSNGIAEKKFFD